MSNGYDLCPEPDEFDHASSHTVFAILTSQCSTESFVASPKPKKSSAAATSKSTATTTPHSVHASTNGSNSEELGHTLKKILDNQIFIDKKRAQGRQIVGEIHGSMMENTNIMKEIKKEMLAAQRAGEGTEESEKELKKVVDYMASIRDKLDELGFGDEENCI